jgi:hypothetical protein
MITVSESRANPAESLSLHYEQFVFEGIGYNAIH